MLQFRWMWVGVPSRKHGWGLIGEIWNLYFGKNERAQLWVKALDPRHFGIEQYNNVTFDFRRLRPADVLTLYRSADACVLPSSGHDWQGPLRKAIYAGVPCVVLSPQGDKANNTMLYPAWEVTAKDGSVDARRVDAIRSMYGIMKEPRAKIAIQNRSDLAKSTDRIIKLLAAS